MVNLSKRPHGGPNSYDTIAKDMDDHRGLFPNVGPMDFSEFKRRSSTIYDIQAQMDKMSEKRASGMVADDTMEKALLFAKLLQGKQATGEELPKSEPVTGPKPGGKGVRFAGLPEHEEEEENEGFEIKISDRPLDEEDVERKRKMKPAVLIADARDSLFITRPKFGIPEPVAIKVIDPEPPPRSVVEILVERLQSIFLAFHLPQPIEGPADTVITVRKSPQNQETERILCHSNVLKRSSNAFREMLDKYQYDMELRHKQDTHIATTTDETFRRTSDAVIPVYLECYLHPHPDLTPPVIRRKVSIHPLDPCVRNDPIENWINPDDIDRTADPVEKAGDEEEENPLYSEYRKLVKEEEDYELAALQKTQSLIADGKEEEPAETEEDKKLEDEQDSSSAENNANPLANLPEDMDPAERRKREAEVLVTLSEPLLQQLQTLDMPDEKREEIYGKFAEMVASYTELTNPKEEGAEEEANVDGSLEGGVRASALKGSRLEKDRLSRVKFVKEGQEQKQKRSIMNGSVGKGSLSMRSSVIGSIPSGVDSTGGSIRKSLLRGSSLQGGSMSGSLRGSQVVRFSQRPSQIARGLRRRRGKSLIKTILYHVVEDPLKDPAAQDLSMEEELDICLKVEPVEPKPVEGEEHLTEEGEGEAVDLSNDGKKTEEAEGEINGEGKEEEEEEEEGEEEEEEEEEEEYDELDKMYEPPVPEKIPPAKPDLYKIIKGEWTCATLHPMMEYFYAERCHVPCEDVAKLWIAANEILLKSLTDLIIEHPLVEYLRLALKTEANRRALHELSYVAKSDLAPEMKRLRLLCESFEYGGREDRLPYTFTLLTAHMANRETEWVEEGMHSYPRLKVCVLRTYDSESRLFEENANRLEFLTFEKSICDQTGLRRRVKRQWQGRKTEEVFLDHNRDKTWSITVFGPNIADECWNLYKHMVGTSLRMQEPETFSLHMPTPYLKMPVLQNAIRKTFQKDELHVSTARNMTYYIGGETHGHSLTITGDPRRILQAMKAIPKDMQGRTSLQFRAPSRTTFIKVFSVTRTLGIDLEKDTLYLLKNLKKLKLALEYLTDWSETAFIPWNVPREFTELVVPSKPF